jgi:hypothetical protein
VVDRDGTVYTDEKEFTFNSEKFEKELTLHFHISTPPDETGEESTRRAETVDSPVS